MRSRLGTKSRLAAHLTALVLLIMMLVYIVPSQPIAESRDDGAISETEVAEVSERRSRAARRRAAEAAAEADAARTASATPPAPAEAVAVAPAEPATTPSAAKESPAATVPAAVLVPATTPPPAAETGERKDPAPAAAVETPSPEITAIQPASADAIADTPEADPAGEAERPAIADDQTAIKPQDAATAAADGPPASEPESTPKTGDDAILPEEPPVPGPSSATDGDAKIPAEMPAEAVVPQPDETGSLAVADNETGFAAPVAAATPLPNVNLEVLGENVYWLDPQHDLEKELAAVPEIGTLILLAPLPGFRFQGFEHIQTEIIPADIADLSDDAAARFLHLTDKPARPVVAAVLPGTRGAAFFKGVYLLARRHLAAADLRKEIDEDLAEAGDAAEEIVHRLERLDVNDLK